MCFLLFANEKFSVGLVIIMSLACVCNSFHSTPMPCNVSLSESCPASLYYVPNPKKSLDETTALFHANSDVIHETVDGFLIEVNCSCPAGHDEFTWHMDYTVQSYDTWDRISSKFGAFVVEKPEKMLFASQIVTLDLLCGCSERVEVLTYRIKSGDTLFIICSRFNASLNETVKLNRLADPELIHEGDVIFIPEPGGLEKLFLHDDKDPKPQKASKLRFHIVVGVIAAAVVIVLVATIVSWNYYHKKKGTRQSKVNSRRMECLHCYLATSPSHDTKSDESSLISSFKSDKATVFPYDEVCDATSNFSISQKIGQGSYGSVYLGKLRGNEVAIKQMKNTKSKEFLSELNILCRVHHTNLIELIGYAAGGDSLFLVYELAQNGALSEHLHSPGIRGYKPLPWTTRVQIALDAAKGLEYIHVHTKPFYVHRDVKTSNILLDSTFRAKIADFGLVKLLEQSPEVGAAASKIVGTFGYLAPEYVRDGRVTTKSDVYAFGVVLMELLTGQPALSKSSCPGNNHSIEHRSVVDYMLSAINNTGDAYIQLTNHVDPSLIHYDKDSFFKMALLSKDCVDDDWNRRPDMSKVVLRLSNILMCSKEWDKL